MYSLPSSSGIWYSVLITTVDLQYSMYQRSVLTMVHLVTGDIWYSVLTYIHTVNLPKSSLDYGPVGHSAIPRHYTNKETVCIV